MSIPRCEYPKPQFERENWINLNGQWQFEIDNERIGLNNNFFNPDKNFSKEITVPFCPESKLSGIENKDFMFGVWYKREFNLNTQQISQKTILHFGAVDYITRVYINGEIVGMHRGGYSSFSFDISSFVKVGANIITVYAEDDTRDESIPSGKQSMSLESKGCCYTRTTGIWQTVWLEFVPKNYIIRTEYRPNIHAQSVTVNTELCGVGDLAVKIFYEKNIVGEAKIKNATGNISFAIALSELHLWELGNGRLYDVEFSFDNDKVKSYFGMRQIKVDGKKFLFNGKSVFQRLILDQGFYPDGIYTAPTDEALKHDIEISMACGFNGARLHEKVFEERFLYYCDKLGYMVWGEYPNWGTNIKHYATAFSILPEWLEIVKRDFNHPAIIGWCPFNETIYGGDMTNGKMFNPEITAFHDGNISAVYYATKAVDETRPCIDTSGYLHVMKNSFAFSDTEKTPNINGVFSPISDIYDVHDYEQNADVFREHYKNLPDSIAKNNFSLKQQYADSAFFVSEWGGIGWNSEKGWGYGNQPKDEEEFFTRLKGLADVLLDNPNICAFCYTQLTDIEQEQNGLVYYDRTPKFDLEKYNKIFSKKAAIED